MTKIKKTVRPIRFHRLEVGSKFNVFAEPSRGIQLSKDKKVYVKTAESYSTELDDAGNPVESNVIILDFEDLVVPLSRPRR